MTLKTRPVFYFDYVVDLNSNKINFNEGSGELEATIAVGSYSLTNFANAFASAMNTVGTQDYSIAIDRDTRQLTISAASNFDLLVSSGSNSGISAFPTAGFTGADRTGANSYEGDPAGQEYRPQFYLQDFVSKDDFKESQEASVNESGSGLVEVVSFGNRQFYEWNDQFITNIPQSTKGAGGPIENNPTGVESVRAFLDYAITRGDIEFMPDRDSTSTFDTILLESTRSNRKGTGYKLRELYGRGLTGYYETGTLKFRVVQ